MGPQTGFKSKIANVLQETSQVWEHVSLDHWVLLSAPMTRTLLGPIKQASWGYLTYTRLWSEPPTRSRPDLTFNLLIPCRLLLFIWLCKAACIATACCCIAGISLRVAVVTGGMTVAGCTGCLNCGTEGRVWGRPRPVGASWNTLSLALPCDNLDRITWISLSFRLGTVWAVLVVQVPHALLGMRLTSYQECFLAECLINHLGRLLERLGLVSGPPWLDTVCLLVAHAVVHRLYTVFPWLLLDGASQLVSASSFFQTCWVLAVFKTATEKWNKSGQ